MDVASEEARGLLERGEKHSTWHHDKYRSRPWVFWLVLAISNLTTFIVTASCSGPINLRLQGLRNGLAPLRPLYANMDRETFYNVNFSAFSLDPSPYTAPPSHEVDARWSELGVEYRTFLVPTSQGPAFGISDKHVIVPADAPGNGGRSGYAVDMEAMHQLHCLNLIRKGQFFNYPYYSDPEHLKYRWSWAFADPSANIRGHINHCIDALRERIMCAADNEVLPYYWRTHHGITISDFAVTRQCRNFDNVREWARENQINDWGTSYRLTTPEDAYIASDILDS